MAEANFFSNLLAQARDLPPARRTMLTLAGVGSLAFFLWVASGARSPEYRLLYRGLAEDEAAQVVDGLIGEKIPYRLDEGGTAIRVPANEVYEARIRLARKGLPHGGGTGFEIFDRQGFGVTDFVQRVNYRRALQGELGRSIEQLEPVQRARVQIALPERRTFVSDANRQPSASVVVRLRPGGDLHEGQVQGVVHLVASSVEGLDPGRGTGVDDRGRLLAPAGDLSPGPTAPSGALSHQARVEEELADRIESILGRTVGVGGVVARVRAEMDWTRTETTEERFDPDSQVARSEQSTTDSSSERRADAGGVPGVFGNSPDFADGGFGADTTASATKTTETVNYEINKTVSHVVSPIGTLRRLSVAVLVDGKPGVAAEEGAEPAAFTPWSADELKQFENLARQAVGFSEERGDQITVTNAPFRMIELAPEDEGLPFLGPDVLVLVGALVRALALILGLVLFARMVMRPLIGALSAPASAPVAMRAGELELQLAGGGGVRDPASAALREIAPQQPSLADRVGSVAEQRSEDSVKTIRNWLHQR